MATYVVGSPAGRVGRCTRPSGISRVRVEGYVVLYVPPPSTTRSSRRVGSREAWGLTASPVSQPYMAPHRSSLERRVVIRAPTGRSLGLLGLARVPGIPSIYTQTMQRSLCWPWITHTTITKVTGVGFGQIQLQQPLISSPRVTRGLTLRSLSHYNNNNSFWLVCNTQLAKLGCWGVSRMGTPKGK